MIDDDDAADDGVGLIYLFIFYTIFFQYGGCSGLFTEFLFGNI